MKTNYVEYYATTLHSAAVRKYREIIWIRERDYDGGNFIFYIYIMGHHDDLFQLTTLD